MAAITSRSPSISVQYHEHEGGDLEPYSPSQDLPQDTREKHQTQVFSEAARQPPSSTLPPP